MTTRTCANCAAFHADSDIEGAAAECWNLVSFVERPGTADAQRHAPGPADHCGCHQTEQEDTAETRHIEANRDAIMAGIRQQAAAQQHQDAERVMLQAVARMRKGPAPCPSLNPPCFESTTMNDKQILIAALKWHRAHEVRLAAGTESNRFKSDEKKRTGFGGADWELSRRVTAAKRVELAALRELAKACAKARGELRQADDAAEVLDVDVKLLSC